LTRRLFGRAQRAVEFASNEALGAATAEGGRQLLSGAPFDPRTGLVAAGAGFAAGLLRYALGPEVSGRAQRLEEGVLDDFARLGMTDEQLDALLDDPEFVTVLLRAYQAAARTHEQTKIDALRNAVVNVATGRSPEDDLRLIFLGLVDEFTPAHLSVLAFCRDRHAFARGLGLLLPEEDPSRSLLPEEALASVFPTMDVITGQQVANDLLSRQLIELERTYSFERVFAVRKPSWTTAAGNRFLDFITAPQES
jgi:hypothetical protein